VCATSIRVVDFQNIIENNKNLILLYEKIQLDQKKYTTEFQNEENQLQKEINEMDQLKLILDNEELEREINQYNQKLNIFNLKIENFNSHYDDQINELKNKIINITLQILKEYSLENKIDLIMDSNTYILSSNSINITNIIKDKSNTKMIEFNFEKY
jgi:Skp family chaperone for outer membrane proteins